MQKSTSKIRKWVERTPEFSIVIALILIMAVTQLGNHNFLTAGNMTALLKSIPFIALATLGTSFCLITRNVDISVGRVAGMAGMVFGSVLATSGNVVLAVAAGVGSGLLVGIINGFLTVYVGLNSFIVTMGTMYVAGGIRYIINGGTAIMLPDSFRVFAQATPLGISWFFWIVVGLFVLMGFIQQKTVIGRQMYAVGSNTEVARLQGVNTKAVQMLAFLISGLFSGIAGVMATIDISSAYPATGTGWEFKAIAACFIGGVSLSGGSGRSFGAALGVFTVFIINNIINMLNISNYYSNVFTGCVLAGAVLVDIVRKSRKIKA